MFTYCDIYCALTLALLFLQAGTGSNESTPLPTEIESLPLVKPSVSPREDYLIDSSPFKANVYRNGDNKEIILDNGLVRRSWRLAPNGACVSYDNLMNGQAMLRSIRPEARVTLNGVAHNVGGLIGQPNHAFLKPKWLNRMLAEPQAMRLTGFNIGVPSERFAWGRRRHAAADATWPPKGAYLRMDYSLPTFAFTDSVASDFARDLLWMENFEILGNPWTVLASNSHGRTSFENEGKPGEIYAPANAHCFAERKISNNTELIEAIISPGTDTATSWGPGLAWVFDHGVVKVNLRPGDRGEHGQFELRINGNEKLASMQEFSDKDKGLDASKKYRLRMRREKNSLLVEAAIDNDHNLSYKQLFSVEWKTDWGRCRAVRVGKMDRQGNSSDGEAGELVRSRILGVAAYGPLDKEKLDEARHDRNYNVSPFTVSVHYELYDGVPVFCKWLTIHNHTESELMVDRFTSEELALVEHSNPVESREGIINPRPQYLHVETDFAAGGFNFDHSNRHVVHWRADSLYTTIVNYARTQPTLLVCEPTYGPSQRVGPGSAFESYRTFELTYGESDRERRGLALRRMYRTIAPWITENPITHHLLTNNPARARAAIEEAAEVGFEAIIFSFGSGFDMLNRDPKFLEQWKDVAGYARKKGIELGTYSLFSSRGVDSKHMIVSPDGQRPTHGRCPSPASEWGRNWLQTIVEFYDQTGFSQFENDGPYPNDVDTTARPPWQQGLSDSRWVQFQLTARMYRELCGRGVYINQPDYYYLNGATKCGMGYREVNWSLPRAHQAIHTRQNIYDGTWQKTPSMGWMFVPLTQYHGGGAAATIEPLNQHLGHYKLMLQSNLGMGVQAHYRGPRLYDTVQTRDTVKEVVDWFKRYRDILESDIIHGRRADGRDLDWILHANPNLNDKGLLCVFNPLEQSVTKTLRVNLYYTGLTDTATISQSDQNPRRVDIERDYFVDLDVTVPAAGMSWYLIR